MFGSNLELVGKQLLFSMILGPKTLVLRSPVNFGTTAQKEGGGIGKIPNCFHNQFGTLLDGGAEGL